jgi:hypothetical protein
MKVLVPRMLATIGGALISASGILNFILGLRIKAVWYDVYPGGNMGHVGMIAGIVAVIIGVIIMFGIARLLQHRSRLVIAIAGILIIILGHLGAVFGALYVGTAGVLCCYVAGIWLLVVAAKGRSVSGSGS